MRKGRRELGGKVWGKMAEEGSCEDKVGGKMENKGGKMG